MADQKISAVTNSTTAPVTTDAYPVVENMTTVPVTKRKPWSAHIATTAEIKTGTAATIIVTPAGLAAAHPVLTAKGSLLAASAAQTPVNLAVGTNGSFVMASSGAASGLAYQFTDQVFLNDTAAHQISNTTTETTANTYTVAANTIGATGMILFDCVGYATNTSGGNDQYDVKLYFGASSINPISLNMANGNTVHWWIKMMVKNTATNAQVYYDYGYHNWTGGAANVIAHGTFAIDTTGAVIVKSTHKWGTASANAISDVYWGRIAYMPNV